MSVAQNHLLLYYEKSSLTKVLSTKMHHQSAALKPKSLKAFPLARGVAYCSTH